MNQEHPIAPPPELVEKWITEGRYQDYCSTTEYTIAQAARWGADAELEACCEWLAYELCHKGQSLQWADDLRAVRRPKPLSLKEQAKFAAAVLRSPDETCSIAELQQHWHTICNALEALPE